MKNKKVLYIILGTLLALLVVSSVYIDFVAKSSAGLTYLLIGQMFIGIIGGLTTLFLGTSAFDKKKNYELLFISFLEILFVLAVVIINYLFGYGKAININDYIDYMGFVSMEFNIFIYMSFTLIIGILTLNLYVKEKLLLKKKEIKEENIEQKA